MKKILCMMLIALCAIGCSNNSQNNGNGIPVPQAYLPISHESCQDSVGINGKWVLVNLRHDSKNFAPQNQIIITIKDCSTLDYYTGDKFIKRDSFKLLRVLNYCADYQLSYISKNDSISCINMKKDTLIFGDCSTFESTRYFYKRL